MLRTACSAFGEFCEHTKAVIRVLDQGSETRLRYERGPCQNLTLCERVSVCVLEGVYVCGWLSQLIPWEGVVSMDHVGSSRGRETLLQSLISR